MRAGRGRRVLGLALGAGALALAWTQLRPTELGGDLTMAVVSGRSMNPGLHAGDLALVHPAADYGPGDVVAYRTDAGAPILHRIVRQLDDGRFVLRGDDNDYEDPYLPTRQEILGRLRVTIPRVGALVDTLRQPRWASPTVGVLAFVVCRRSLRRTTAARAAA